VPVKNYVFFYGPGYPSKSVKTKPLYLFYDRNMILILTTFFFQNLIWKWGMSERKRQFKKQICKNPSKAKLEDRVSASIGNEGHIVIRIQHWRCIQLFIYVQKDIYEIIAKEEHKYQNKIHIHINRQIWSSIPYIHYNYYLNTIQQIYVSW